MGKSLIGKSQTLEAGQLPEDDQKALVGQMHVIEQRSMADLMPVDVQRSEIGQKPEFA